MNSVSKQYKGVAVARRQVPPALRFLVSSKVAHHSASSSKSRFTPQAGMFTFIDVWRRTHQFKTSTGETSAFDAELNTATDSVNDEAAAR